MNIVENKFINKAINRHGILLITKDHALDLVKECEVNEIQILGIDAFRLIGQGIQPDMDNSIDISLSKELSNSERYKAAVQFLETRGNDLYFEITCSE